MPPSGAAAVSPQAARLPGLAHFQEQRCGGAELRPQLLRHAGPTRPRRWHRGTLRLQVAYAPAGSLGEGGLLATDRVAWAATLDTSAYSLLALARHTAPLMEAAGGGSLMALSFVGAVRTCPSYGVMGPAKAALEALARGLAAELGPAAIRVNTIRCDCRHFPPTQL